MGERSITEFNYRYTDSAEAQVFTGVKISGGDAEKQLIMNDLQKHGYKVLDLTDNELAKVHLRFMVGGHAQSIDDERLFRFSFPEKPGALLHFLTSMGGIWNISLFHYRNHGSDFGRVLTGIQVPANEHDKFTQFLEDLGYEYWDETDNPAYQSFLR